MLKTFFTLVSCVFHASATNKTDIIFQSEDTFQNKYITHQEVENVLKVVIFDENLCVQNFDKVDRCGWLKEVIDDDVFLFREECFALRFWESRCGSWFLFEDVTYTQYIDDEVFANQDIVDEVFKYKCHVAISDEQAHFVFEPGGCSFSSFFFKPYTVVCDMNFRPLDRGQLMRVFVFISGVRGMSSRMDGAVKVCFNGTRGMLQKSRENAVSTCGEVQRSESMMTQSAAANEGKYVGIHEKSDVCLGILLRHGNLRDGQFCENDGKCDHNWGLDISFNVKYNISSLYFFPTP